MQSLKAALDSPNPIPHFSKIPQVICMQIKVSKSQFSGNMKTKVFYIDI